MKPGEVGGIWLQMEMLPKAVGAVMSRSAAQQIAHWARIGRELEAAGSISSRDIARVLAGSGDYDSLNAREQAVVRAEWVERISARLADLDLERDFTEQDVSYVELDDGHVVRRRPGTTGT